MINLFLLLLTCTLLVGSSSSTTGVTLRVYQNNSTATATNTLQLNVTTAHQQNNVSAYHVSMWHSLHQCTAPTSTVAGYKVIKHHYTCGQQTSLTALPLSAPHNKLQDCYTKCNAQAGCFYFNYGSPEAALGTGAFCQWVHTAASSCPEDMTYDSTAGFYKIANERTELMDAVGSGWVLVRTLKPNSSKWFAATDNLAGTDVYGDPTLGVQASWSIPFDAAMPGWDEFLFLTGDCERYLVTTKAMVSGNYDLSTTRSIIKSSVSATSYDATWMNRANSAEDPWISMNDHDHYAKSYYLLYGENSFGYESTALTKPTVNFDSGVYVYIRKSTEQAALTFRLNASSNGVTQTASGIIPTPFASVVRRVVHVKTCTGTGKETCGLTLAAAATDVPPQPIINVRVNGSNSLRVTVEQNPEDGGNVVQQHIFENVRKNVTFVRYANQTNTFLLNNIVNATRLPSQVSVKACNSFGCGLNSIDETGVPSPPSSLNVRVKNSTTLVATAIVPIDDGGSLVQTIEYFYDSYSTCDKLDTTVRNMDSYVLNGNGVCAGTKEDFDLLEMKDVYKSLESLHSSNWFQSDLGTGMCNIGNQPGGVDLCSEICKTVVGCTFFSTSTTQYCYACFIHKSCPETGRTEFKYNNYQYLKKKMQPLVMLKYGGGQEGNEMSEMCGSSPMCLQPTGVAGTTNAQSKPCDAEENLQLFRMDEIFPIEAGAGTTFYSMGWFKLVSKQSNYEYCLEMADSGSNCYVVSLQLCSSTSLKQNWRFDKFNVEEEWKLGRYSYNKPVTIVNQKSGRVLDSNNVAGCSSGNEAWGCVPGNIRAKSWMLVPAGTKLTNRYPQDCSKDITVANNFNVTQLSLTIDPKTEVLFAALTSSRQVAARACNSFGCSKLLWKKTRSPMPLTNVNIRISSSGVLNVSVNPSPDDGGSATTKYIVKYNVSNDATIVTTTTTTAVICDTSTWTHVKGAHYCGDCKVLARLPTFAPNVFKTNVVGAGGWGGSCTCPDGTLCKIIYIFL